MSRLTLVILVLILLVGSASLALAQASADVPVDRGKWGGYPIVLVLTNGKVLSAPRPCVVIEGYTYCCLRGIAQHVGGTLEWDGRNRLVRFTYDERIDELSAELRAAATEEP